MTRTVPFLLTLALAFALLTAGGCASNPLRPDTAMQDEVQQLRQRIVELQREARMNEVEMARLRQQVAELEARNGGARPAPAANPPATSRAPEPRTPAPAPTPAPARPAAPLPSTTAPATPRREAPAPRTPIEEEDLDVPQPAPQRPAPSIPSAGSGGDEAELLSLSAQALYDRGYTLYHQGRFVDAETSFQRFLQTNPENELADNAQYWIGECRYSRNDMRGALAAFREVIEKHPKGNKVPDALLKAGQCLEAMGDIEGARVTYREVGRRFPGSAAATVADERRAKLP